MALDDAPRPSNPDTTALLQRWGDTSTALGPRDTWPTQLTVLLSLVMNSTQAMFIAWGPQLRLFYNDAYARIIGERHPAAFGEPMRTLWADLWPLVGPFVDRVLAGRPTDIEDLTVPIERAGHHGEGHFSFSCTPIFDDHGAVPGFFCSCAEITQRVLHHEAQREVELAERRYRELLDAMGEGLIVLNRNYEVILINETGVRMDARPREAILGRIHWDAWPNAATPDVKSAFARVLEQRESVEMRHHYVSDTADVWVDMRAYPVSDGLACLYRDVTDVVVAETALRHSEERFRAAIEAIGVMWTNTAEGRMAGPQPGWERLTGQSQAEYQGYGWADAVHPDDQAASIAAWEAAVRERTTYSFEHRVRRRDGQWRRFSARAVPVLDESGQLREWVGVHIDITEAADAAEALREADRRKDEFIATLAHELRNPLAPVRSAAYLLGRDDVDLERQARCGAIIRRQVDTMAVLLDDLLDISRITTGRLELRRRYIDAQEVVRSAVEIARPLVDARHHHLQITIAPGLPQLDADPIRVAQVLGNLLTNAAKYTDDGGHIRLDISQVNAHLRFEVSDNGIGIAADMLPRIFEMFRQVPSGVNRAAGGLGIGLSLTQGLVHLHGGTIHAASAGLGKGSTFTVMLPAARRSTPIRYDAGDTQDARTEGGTQVLVVDDNVDAADTLALLLENEGYRVHVAHCAEEALRVGEQVHPALALLDIGLPDFSGYELAQAIHHTVWGHGLALAAITGWGQEEDRRQAMAAGFNQHFTKPVNPDALLDWLGQQRAVRRAGTTSGGVRGSC